MLALSAREQYAAQQADQRAKRQQRMEAEAGGGAEEDEAEAKKRASFKAEVVAFEQQYSRPLAIFNQDLFPPEQYDQRNGESRKDGYWKFVGKGEEPPIDFTYGEFPLPLFAKLVDRACELRQQLQGGEPGARDGIAFADLGSGAGRLALWAAATSAWKSVVGVEYLPGLAEVASEKLSHARGIPSLLVTANVELIEG